MNEYERLEQWVTETNERLERIRLKHKAEWEYLRSEEYQEEVRRRIISATTEQITPPWEE